MSDGVILGVIEPGETRTMSFRIKIAGESEFTEKETTLVNSVEVSGRNFESIKDNLMITVGNSGVASSSGFASISSLFGGNWFWGLLLFGLALFILLLLLLLIYLIYLLLKRDRDEKESLERQKYEAERSKYFQIQ
jgi:uncharacterized membrane protein